MAKPKGGVKKDSSKNVLPFMDTFYALTSDESSERTLAASSLLQHVFLPNDKDDTKENNESVTIKDGYYALTRLLKGLCSGRASARQGYASCLTTFLKLAFKAGPSTGESQSKCWMDCFMECAINDGQNINKGTSAVEFVRSQLISHTSFTSSSGDKHEKRNKGGSEERDHIFGKLFGISAIVRSGILAKDSSNAEVIKAFVSDLVTLYNHKRWMREPTAHALQELLSFIADTGKINVIEELLNDQLSNFFDQKKKTWNVEEIALYIHLQATYMDQKIALPKKLSQPLLTSSSLTGGKSSILETLRDTSNVVHPRCHLVWSSIWSYLTTTSASSATDVKKKGGNNIKGDDYLLSLKNRELRAKLVGEDTATDIITALVNQVIIVSLLGGHQQKDIQNEQKNSTHERKALALSLVNQLCMLRIPPSVLEEVVLQPTIITKVFLHTLQVQGHNSNMPRKHTLKELASYVLNNIVESSQESYSQRMILIRSLIKTTPMFDTVTKTETLKRLLTLNAGFDGTEQPNTPSLDRSLLWKEFISFMEKQILDSSQSMADIQKNVDLLYTCSKLMLRDGKEKDLEHLFHQILSFFMAGAFFDFKNFKLGKIDNESKFAGIIEAAQLLRNDVKITYDVRVTLSSRFYSLLSDGIVILSAQKSHSEQRSGFSRTKDMHDTLEFLCAAWDTILSHGACNLVQSEEEAATDRENILKIKRVCDEVNQMVQKNYEDKPKPKAALGIAFLLSSLCLHLLSPGSRDLSSDEEDFDENENEEENYNSEILDFMLELSRMIEVISGKTLLPPDEDADESDSNKLDTLASICVDILSSPLGGDLFVSNSPRGMASKLLKEGVKAAWSGGLALLKGEPTSDDFSMDEDVMSTILRSICGEEALTADEDEEMEDESDNDDEGNEDGIGVFTEAASMNIDGEDNEDISMTEKSASDNASQDDEDIELDPSALENLLLEDSDADSDTEGVLEHHEGADSALATLIKAKQDARKAGQKKREKIETSYRLRCIVLLESIFARGHDLSQNVVFMTILPLLRARRKLDKSITMTTASINGVKKVEKALMAEKRSLSEKITALLKGKIGKFNFNGAAKLEDCSSMSSEVMTELKKGSSTAHNSCCSSLFILFVKAVSQKDSDSVAIAKSIYTDAIKEWSTNRKTKLSTFVFSDFIMQCPSVARVVLINAMTTAAMEGRSSYYKKESFQLLTSLYNNVPSGEDKNQSEVDALNQAVPGILLAIETATNNAEMLQKTYIEPVLKCAEKVISYLQDNDNTITCELLDKLKTSISSVSDKSENVSIKNMCAKLISEISAGVENVQKSGKKEDIKDSEKVHIDEKKVSSGKKKKKGNKKKKKGKKK